MPVAGSGSSNEPVYWETQDGAIVGDVQSGPGPVVGVDAHGPYIVNGGGGLLRLRTAGAARWLGLRLIEAAVIWEREVNRERA